MKNITIDLVKELELKSEQSLFETTCLDEYLRIENSNLIVYLKGLNDKGIDKVISSYNNDSGGYSLWVFVNKINPEDDIILAILNFNKITKGDFKCAYEEYVKELN